MNQFRLRNVLLACSLVAVLAGLPSATNASTQLATWSHAGSNTLYLDNGNIVFEHSAPDGTTVRTVGPLGHLIGSNVCTDLDELWIFLDDGGKFVVSIVAPKGPFDTAQTLALAFDVGSLPLRQEIAQKLVPLGATSRSASSCVEFAF